MKVVMGLIIRIYFLSSAVGLKFKIGRQTDDYQLESFNCSRNTNESGTPALDPMESLICRCTVV